MFEFTAAELSDYTKIQREEIQRIHEMRKIHYNILVNHSAAELVDMYLAMTDLPIYDPDNVELEKLAWLYNNVEQAIAYAEKRISCTYLRLNPMSFCKTRLLHKYYIEKNLKAYKNELIEFIHHVLVTLALHKISKL